MPLPAFVHFHSQRAAASPVRPPSPSRSAPVQIHWYGLTYLVAFGLFLFLANRRAAMPQFALAGWTRRDVEDLLFFGVVGVVVGGRLGYALFYKPGQYLANPLEITGRCGRAACPSTAACWA